MNIKNLAIFLLDFDLINLDFTWGFRSELGFIRPSLDRNHLGRHLFLKNAAGVRRCIGALLKHMPEPPVVRVLLQQPQGGRENATGAGATTAHATRGPPAPRAQSPPERARA